MQNKALMQLLEQLDPDDEICVEIFECITDKFVDSTYDIGYDRNEYDQLVLKVSVEKDKFNCI
jgi:Mg2+ and Co2+ transporter CorA